MKKFISCLMSTCLLMSMVACGAKATPSPAPTSAPTVAPVVADENTSKDTTEQNTNTAKDPLPSYKIIFTYGNFADVTGGQLKSSMEYLAPGMNVEFVFLETGYGEESVATLEAAVARGDIDGIILAQAASPALLTAAQGIPLVSACSAPSREEEAKEISGFSNYLGSIINGDYAAGKDAAQALYDAGCRKICFAGLTQGMSKAHDDRRAGFMDFLNDHPDMKLLGEDFSRGQAAQAVSSFAAAFPDMDGFFASASNGVLTAIQTEGLVGKLKASIFDVYARKLVTSMIMIR